MTKLTASPALTVLNKNDSHDVAVELTEALKSVDAETGHSAEQVFGWLNDWASGEKKPIPKPDIFPNR
jgi:hypothetical protein